uniref:RNA polymerase alpha subunit n=1 Tax=Compsopogon caeruleus TaxID=31354 RepID=A0A1Z1XBC4_9RHOD|nr:RNA polymerase alpha subunit [Compsopogon caeruleus]ARX96097.1 RNA polymerase alpha subunit [Compsopogon caeruleus]
MNKWCTTPIFSLDLLQIDAVFMPVKKVNYTVEELKTSPSLVKDKLILEIWTNGSIMPQEAIIQASNILTDLFTPLKYLNLKTIDNNVTKEDKKISQVLIEELQLSVRAYNCLKRAQIHSVATKNYIINCFVF